MPGCFLVLALLALAAFVGGQGLAVGELPVGFVVGLVAGLLVSLLGVFNLGWNAHVDHVEQRDHARARDTAERDRR